MRGVLLAAFLLAAGCGGASTEVVGHSTGAPPPEPITLSVQTTDGSFVDLRRLRGRPVLLFLFATFDGVSQAALHPLRGFVRQHPEVHVVGIAIEPDARRLGDAWAAALNPPFPVAYDPDDDIVGGTSSLGTVDTVPTYVMLDAAGIEVNRKTGFASERDLSHLLYEATHNRPPGEPTEPPPPPPLLGN